MSTRPNLGWIFVVAKRRGRARILSESGFTGFCQLVFGRQSLVRVRLGGISRYAEKRKLGEVKS